MSSHQVNSSLISVWCYWVSFSTNFGIHSTRSRF